jgi:hypothetical protein
MTIGRRALGFSAIGDSALAATLTSLSSPFLKLPPSPAYFCFWGGVGLFLILSVFLVVERRWLPRATRIAEILGQNSLFIFLLQEHLYVLVLWSWNPPYGLYWPMLLLGTIAVAIGLTYLWHLLGWSRHLTVGYGRWWGPRPVALREPR